MQRSASPFRAPSPFNPQQIPSNQYTAYPTQLPTGVAQVGPGATTYTTSIGPDGRPIYTPYKYVTSYCATTCNAFVDSLRHKELLLLGMSFVSSIVHSTPSSQVTVLISTIFSYHTPNGIVSGIQWIPQEATSTMPPGPPQV